MTSIIDFGEKPNRGWFDGYGAGRAMISMEVAKIWAILEAFSVDNLLALEAGDQTMAFFDALDNIPSTPYKQAVVFRSFLPYT